MSLKVTLQQICKILESGDEQSGWAVSSRFLFKILFSPPLSGNLMIHQKFSWKSDAPLITFYIKITSRKECCTMISSSLVRYNFTGCFISHLHPSPLMIVGISTNKFLFPLNGKITCKRSVFFLLAATL